MSEEDDMLGQQMESARKARGWSQDELATAAAVSRKTIYSLENGEDVSTRSLGKILLALGLKIRLVPDAAPTLDDVLAENRERTRERGS